MELYKIYNFCSVGLFVLIAHLFVILICCSGFYKSEFFDLINHRIESYKAKSLCTSLVSLFLSFIILFSNNQFIIMLGCKDIRVMPEGTYCYYVYATNEKGKTYTLPAKITKSYDPYEYESMDGNIHIKKSEVFYINNVYFKNGGYLYFPNGDYFEYGDTFNCYDQSDREWKIELANRKTSHEKAEETEPLQPWKLLMPFVEIIIICISTILYTLRIRKK